MKYRQLGNTDLQVSALSLGTVALGMAYGITPQGGEAAREGMPPPTLDEATRLVHAALDGGINFIDTARGYGRSEEILGHALQGKRERVVLATKIGCFDREGNILRGSALRQAMEASIAESLRLLRTDYVDLLMLHSAPVPLLRETDAMEILGEFREKGYARAIGASTYGEEAARVAIEQGANALQVAFNLFDQRLAAEVFPLARAAGTGIVVRSVFLKGVLTPRAEDLPDRLEKLKAQSRAAAAYGADLTPPLDRIELALRFVLSRPDVTTALVGVRTEAELQASLASAEAEQLPAGVLERLAAFALDDPQLLDPGAWGEI